MQFPITKIENITTIVIKTYFKKFDGVCVFKITNMDERIFIFWPMLRILKECAPEILNFFKASNETVTFK